MSAELKAALHERAVAQVHQGTRRQAPAARARTPRPARRRNRPRKVPRQMLPINVEKRYFRRIVALLSPLKAIVDRLIMPHLVEIITGKRDSLRADESELVSRLMHSVRLNYARVVDKTRDSAEGAADDAATKAAAFNKGQTGKQFEVLGIDVLEHEPWLADTIEEFTKRNVDLITSIADTYLDQVEQLVGDAALSGRRPESLANDIEERFSVSKSRAAFIARDQLSKFNGELTKTRQTAVGVTSYIWRTSKDERVRDSHREKEGQTFEWANPPDDTGAPGEDYQCRCTAEPVLDEEQTDEES